MDRSEIKKSYKITGAPMGVYKITNPSSGNIFLGSAKNLTAIMNRHRFELEMNSHNIPELQQAWKKSGGNEIKFEIIDTLEPKEDPGYDYSEDLQELENLWIQKFMDESLKIIRLKNTRLAK